MGDGETVGPEGERERESPWAQTEREGEGETVGPEAERGRDRAIGPRGRVCEEGLRHSLPLPLSGGSLPLPCSLMVHACRTRTTQCQYCLKSESYRMG